MARHEDRDRRWREEEELRRSREDWREQERDLERQGWRGEGNDWMTYGREDFGRQARQWDRDREGYDFDQSQRMSGGEDMGYNRGMQGNWGQRRDMNRSQTDWGRGQQGDWGQRRDWTRGQQGELGQRRDWTRGQTNWDQDRDWGRGQEYYGRAQQDFAGRGGRYEGRDFERTNRQRWDRDFDQDYDRSNIDAAGRGGRYESRDFDRTNRQSWDRGEERSNIDFAGRGGRYEERDFDRTNRVDWDRDRDWTEDSGEDINRMEMDRWRNRRHGRAPHHFAGSGGNYERRDFDRSRMGGMAYDDDTMYDDDNMEWTYTEIWEIEGPFTGMGPQGYRRSDDRIFEDICERLTQHGQIDASDITVKINDGDVVLTGSVDDRRTKRIVEDVAASVNGVSDVQNQLRVHHEQGRRQGRWQDRDRDHDRDQGTTRGMTSGMTGTQGTTGSPTGMGTQTTGTQAGTQGRTTGRTTGSRAGRGSELRNKVRQGMRVVGSDNEDIGEVKEISGNEMLVDRPMARDVYVPLDAAENVTGQHIKLNIPADEVNNQGWRNPDLMGDDDKS
jgi:hypothetical protein